MDKVNGKFEEQSSKNTNGENMPIWNTGAWVNSASFLLQSGETSTPPLNNRNEDGVPDWDGLCTDII